MAKSKPTEQDVQQRTVKMRCSVVSKEFSADIGDVRDVPAELAAELVDAGKAQIHNAAVETDVQDADDEAILL